MKIKSIINLICFLIIGMLSFSGIARATVMPPMDENSTSSYGYVTNNGVNFRSAPGGSRITVLNEYAFALVLGSTEADGKTWYKVNHAGTEGYISGDYFHVLSLVELEDFLQSPEYIQGNSDGSPKPQEDQNAANWTDPNHELTGTYEPFDPYATPDSFDPYVTPGPYVADAITEPWTVPVLIPQGGNTLPSFTNSGFSSIDNNTVLEEGRDFFEGKAWVKPQGERWLCIDKDGRVCFALEHGDTPISDFSHGIAILDGNRLVNEDGVIISQASPDTYDNIITDVYTPAMEYFENFYGFTNREHVAFQKSNAVMDGVVFVEKHYDTYSLTDTWVGVIGYNGQWICEPNDRLAEFLEILEGNWDARYAVEKVYYLGEGWVQTTVSDFSWDSVDYLFNIYTGKYYTLPGTVSRLTDISTLQGEIHFSNIENQYLVAYDNNYLANIYHFDITNEGWTFREVFPNALLTKTGLLGNGLFYVDAAVGLLHQDEQRGFYGISAEVELDVSQYEFVSTPCFADGYSVADVTNQAGVRYLSIIDTNGDLMFEPIKYMKYGQLCCGTLKLFIAEANDYQKSECIFIDIHGNQIGPNIVADEIYDYSDGFARIVDEGYTYYIDTNGKMVFGSPNH